MKKRFQLSRHNISILLLVFLMLGTLYAVSSFAPKAQTPQGGTKGTLDTKVTLSHRSSAGLHISAAKIESNSDSMTTINLAVVNTSTESITAYAIRYDILTGEHRSGGGSELSIKQSINSVLKPGQYELTTVDVDVSRHLTDIQVRMSVDFVEFTDGTTTGPDLYRSKERLEGQRIGGHKASETLQGILKSQGQSTLLSLIDDGGLELSAPSDKSPEWIAGFRDGIGIVRARLKQAYSENRFQDIESVLNQPIDALDAIKRK